MTKIKYINIMIALAVNIHTYAQDTVRQRDWPVGVPMDEESVEWRQDVYRELDLTNARNEGLYSGSNQEDVTTGLFAKIFDLAITRKIDLYKYEIDGNERLTKNNQTKVEDILDDFHINYTSKGDAITVNKSDIPYAEVTTFYLKEALYFDAINSSFQKRVIALCPVIVMEDEFSDEPVRYPLFWVKYPQLEKYLHSIYTIPDYRNIASRMPMDEYFAMNLYYGEIYKVYNIYGNALPITFKNDTTLQVERQRITENMHKIRRTTYNIYYSNKIENKEEKAAVKEKIKYKWIFPWQKKKMLKATEQEKTDNKKNNSENNNI